MKHFLVKNLSRIVRLFLALLLIYVSMIFYLKLSERRIAFPRAIVHKEARTNILGKADSVFCTLQDSMTLEGFRIGNSSLPLVLYFPETEEDAAQFIAEITQAKNAQFIAYNYRGSGKNKGTPEEQNFLADAFEIYACAEQFSSRLILAGRSEGAILALKTRKENNPVVLIDPVESIQEKIAEKYRFLFPGFLVQTQFKIDASDLKKQGINLMLEDRNIKQKSNNQFKTKYKEIPVFRRTGETLSEVFDKILVPEK